MLKITRNSAVSLCRYVNKDICKKRGPKFRINKGQKLLITRTISKLKDQKKKVNATKVKKECDLNISVWTIQRHMRRGGMRYTKVPSKIYLGKKHKEDRVSIVSTWVTENHSWEKIVFSDKNGSVWTSQMIGELILPKTKRLAESEDNAVVAVLWFG